MDWDAIITLMWPWIERVPALLAILLALRKVFGTRKTLAFMNGSLLTYKEVAKTLLEHSRRLDSDFVEEFIRNGIEKDYGGVKVQVRMGGDAS